MVSGTRWALAEIVESTSSWKSTMDSTATVCARAERGWKQMGVEGGDFAIFWCVRDHVRSTPQYLS